ncbi:cell envelope integrity EipB family protein [Alphaproteobacteria bacterium]|nr:cell envelope integrity EipB family protein [Alphaproteobacteria bacterium]
MIRLSLYSLLLIVNTFLYVNTSLSSTIVSHKAYYELEFLTIETPSLVNGGSGKSSFLLEKQCKGWALKETFAITFNLNNKSNSKNFSIFSSFEDFKAKTFSFEHLDKNDFDKEMFYSGYVQKNKNVLDGIIFEKNNEKFIFNDDILFPTEHLETLLEKARKNIKFHTAKVFFGSDKDNLVKIVSAFIGKKTNTFVSIENDLLKKQVWPIQLSFYDLNQKNPDPKTKVIAYVDESGIAHSYTVDYGSYKMKGNLVGIEKVNNLEC